MSALAQLDDVSRSTSWAQCAHLVRLAVSCTCMGGIANVAMAATSDSPRSVEEVVVTARKTGERLQDVPISVTAITGEKLESLGAVDVKDILGAVPGLAFSNVERGQSKYAVRGLATSNGLAPTVGVYMDDISLLTNPSVFTGAFDAVFFDIERLEVLKGPQGTLYGGSAMGGAIKYVSARPNVDAQSFNVAANTATTAHGDPSYGGEAVVNLPIIPGILALRGGVYANHEGGFIDNIAGLNIENTARSSTSLPTYTPLLESSRSTQSKKDYNFSDTYVYRLSLLWQPDPSLSIRPAVLYQDSTIENPSYFFTNQPGLVSSFRFVSQPTTDRAGIYSLDINKALGGVEFTSLSAYFDRNYAWNRDYSFYIGNLVRGLYNTDSFAHEPVHSRILSQEFRVASAQGSDSALRWLAGLYYSTLEEDFNAVINTYGAGFANDIGYAQKDKTEFDQYAAFGEVTYQITNAFDITAGVRAFEFKRETSNTQVGPLSGNNTSGTKIKEDGVNPKVGMSYKLNDDHLLYASAAKGFRPGGVSGSTLPGCAGDLARLGRAAGLSEFDADSVWSYELGSKNEFDGGRATVNGAIFYSNWKDIQQSVRLPSCGAAVTDNAGDARVRGAELEVQIHFTPDLQMGGSVAYTDAEIVKQGAFPFAAIGDRVLETPEWTTSFYGSYFVPVSASWNLELRGDYQYRGSQRRQYDTGQSVRFALSPGVYGPINGSVPYAAVYQDSYDVVNAFASLGNGRTSVRLFVNNALDAQPLIDTNLSVGVSRSTTIRPKTVGVELRQKF